MHCGAETLRCGRCFGGVDVEEDGREFVATDPGDDVPAAQHQREGRRHGAQHRVAGLMTELVVHALQMVDVDREDRERLPGNRPEDTIELAPVLQPGEAVGARQLRHPERLLAQRALRANPGDNVAGLGADLGDGLRGERLNGRQRLEEVREHADAAGRGDDRTGDRRTHTQGDGGSDLRRRPELVEVGDRDQRARWSARER